jgi:hypothetical protein
MDRRPEDKEKKRNPPNPEGKREQVEPKVQSAKKDKKTHFFLKAALCLPSESDFCNAHVKALEMGA